MAETSNLGSNIGGFIGGITDPLFGGTTTVSTTTQPVKTKGSYTPIIIGVVGIVVLVLF